MAMHGGSCPYAKTLSRLILLPYFAVAMLLVAADAITLLFAQLNLRRQGRSRREHSQQRYKIARYREIDYRLTR